MVGNSPDTEMIHDVGVNERPQFTDLRDNL